MENPPGNLLSHFLSHILKGISVSSKDAVSKELIDIPITNLITDYEKAHIMDTNDSDSVGPDPTLKSSLIHSTRIVANPSPSNVVLSEDEEELNVNISSPDVTPLAEK